MRDTPELQTVGAIAAGEGLPVHRVTYAVESNNIEPDQRAGIIRLFGPDKVSLIRSALRRIAKRKGELVQVQAT